MHMNIVIRSYMGDIWEQESRQVDQVLLQKPELMQALIVRKTIDRKRLFDVWSLMVVCIEMIQSILFVLLVTWHQQHVFNFQQSFQCLVALLGQCGKVPKVLQQIVSHCLAWTSLQLLWGEEKLHE